MTDRYDTGRKSPPEDEEWPRIWRTLDKAEELYRVLKPVVAILRSWRWMAGIALVSVAMNSGGYAEALKAIVSMLVGKP